MQCAGRAITGLVHTDFESIIRNPGLFRDLLGIFIRDRPTHPDHDRLDFLRFPATGVGGFAQKPGTHLDF